MVYFDVDSVIKRFLRGPFYSSIYVLVLLVNLLNVVFVATPLAIPMTFARIQQYISMKSHLNAVIVHVLFLVQQR